MPITLTGPSAAIEGVTLSAAATEFAISSISFSGSGGVVTELLAASALAINKITLDGLVYTDGATEVTISLCTGPATETVRAVSKKGSAGAAYLPFTIVLTMPFVAGTRVSWKIDKTSGTAAINGWTGMTVEERTS